MTEDQVPRFARGFRFRRDDVRDQWVVLGPERAFVPDDIAVEVLRLIDGARPLAALIDNLAARFAAPRPQIATDVTTLIQEMTKRGVLTTQPPPTPPSI